MSTMVQCLVRDAFPSNGAICFDLKCVLIFQNVVCGFVATPRLWPFHEKLETCFCLFHGAVHLASSQVSPLVQRVGLELVPFIQGEPGNLTEYSDRQALACLLQFRASDQTDGLPEQKIDVR